MCVRLFIVPGSEGEVQLREEDEVCQSAVKLSEDGCAESVLLFF